MTHRVTTIPRWPRHTLHFSPVPDETLRQVLWLRWALSLPRIDYMQLIVDSLPVIRFDR